MEVDYRDISITRISNYRPNENIQFRRIRQDKVGRAE